MPQFIVFAVDDDADAFEVADEAEQDRRYGADERFVALLQERGGRVVGGADLSHPRDTRVLTKDGDGGALVSEGPFAETVEQLSGFYIVEAERLDDVLAAAELMLEGHTRLEVRPRPAEEAS